MLVLTEAGAYTVFESETGFKLTWPTRCKTDQSASTATKLYIYLADDTPVDAITVSTDESFNERATLDTVTERYADAITSSYKELKVLSKERTDFEWECRISHNLQRHARCPVPTTIPCEKRRLK